MTEQKLPSIDIVLDEVRRTLDFQFEQLDGLDTKSGIVLGIAGVILALLVTSLLGQSSSVVNSSLVKVALAAIILSLILSFVTIYIRKYNRPPNLERLRSYYISLDAEETKRNIIDISMDAIQKNEELIHRRVCLVKCSYFILGIGLGLLAVWIGLVLWQ